MPMNGRCQELESTSHPHSSRRFRAGTRECQCQCPRRPQRRTVDREARRREASTFPRHHWTGARNSHLKCPIGQTVAKSLEKWTSNLRTYSSYYCLSMLANRDKCSWCATVIVLV